MWISDDEWARIQATVPIACVDFVPVRRDGDGTVDQVGLIRRHHPDDGRLVWCHLGGRIRYGESVIDALERHRESTIDVVPEGDEDAEITFGLLERPVLSQWFPQGAGPQATDGPGPFLYGEDPRKHSVSVGFSAEIIGVASVATGRSDNEAVEFRWLPATELGHLEWWSGSKELVRRVAAAVEMD